MSNSPDSSFDYLRNKVCRLCLEESSKLAYLANLYLDDTLFIDIIKDCFGIEINLNQDRLPSFICKRCLVSTLNFHLLKNTIIENEVFLQNINWDGLSLKIRSRTTNDLLDIQRFNQGDFEYNSNENASTENGVSQDNNTETFENNVQTEDTNETDISNLTGPNDIPNMVLGQGQDNHYPSNESLNSSNIECSICSSFLTYPNRNDNGFSTHRSCITLQGHDNSSSLYARKTYSCRICRKKCATPSEWKSHMISHYAPSKYNCRKCCETFKNKRELVDHNNRHVFGPQK